MDLNIKNIILDAGNSGTLSRLILGLLIHTKKIIIKGDKSLSKRDFLRVTKPLKNLEQFLKPPLVSYQLQLKEQICKTVFYIEKKGSAQCKSSVMFAALNTSGVTTIKAKKSRDHSELIFKHLKLPIKVKKTNNYDLIKIKGKSK